VQNFQELIGCSKYSWECPFVPHNTLTDEPIILFNKCYFLPAEEQNRKGTIFSFFISFILEKDWLGKRGRVHMPQYCSSWCLWKIGNNLGLKLPCLSDRTLE
jgi:hypothetical protein